MKSRLFMRNRELLVTNFLHQIFLDVLKDTPPLPPPPPPPPTYCLSPPIKENLLFHQPITFYYHLPLYLILKEASTPIPLPLQPI